MKLFAVIFFMSVSYNLFAQEPVFVRVYNLTGQKIYRGNVLMVTDTSLQLKGKPETIIIPVRKIGSIKTKRSPGNNILIGSLAGAAAGAAMGIATADPDELFGYTSGEGAGAGILLGAPVGAAVGGLTALFKNSNTYLIEGDVTKWKAFQTTITRNNVK